MIVSFRIFREIFQKNPSETDMQCEHARLKQALICNRIRDIVCMDMIVELLNLAVGFVIGFTAYVTIWGYIHRKNSLPSPE